MEKDSNYLEIYEPALQSTVMRVACEHLGKTQHTIAKRLQQIGHGGTLLGVRNGIRHGYH